MRGVVRHTVGRARHVFDDCPGWYIRPVPEVLIGNRSPYALTAEARWAAERGLARPWQEWPAKLWRAVGVMESEAADVEQETAERLPAAWEMPEPQGAAHARVEREVIVGHIEPPWMH